ncbi:MAG TPA: hypothetical protein VFN68_07870 [Acidimicrobiales bacterium]|nr:hypothetical protein [Acidimicrobiales bacterium]
MARSTGGRLAGTAALFTATFAFGLHDAPRAFADASAPPPFSSLPAPCPAATYPPAGAPPNAPFTPYGVPFRAIIYDGQITLPPDVVIPHLYAVACGLVQLPQLTGTIQESNIVLATPNIYVAGLEALPASVSFGKLTADVSMTPAANGGLDITVTGSTQASVSTLGFTCGITLNASFTTLTDGKLSGQPVTGPTQDGQAVAVGNSFPVPAVVGSDTGSCPPSVAQTFNQVLGLPAAPGRATFTAPFCFDFELEHTNIPAPTPTCPWPRS